MQRIAAPRQTHGNSVHHMETATDSAASSSSQTAEPPPYKNTHLRDGHLRVADKSKGSIDDEMCGAAVSGTSIEAKVAVFRINR